MFKKNDDKETKGKIGFLSGIIMGIALVVLVFFLFLLITAWIQEVKLEQIWREDFKNIS